MLELGIGVDVVRGIGLLYWFVFLACIAFAVWIGGDWKRKLTYSLVLALLFVVPVSPGVYRTFEYRQKYVQAKALFDERCKTAGVKVYQTAKNVEGVLLLNVRPGRTEADRADPNWSDAGLPDEAGADGYIRTFLYWEHLQYGDRRGFLNSEKANLSGYLVAPGYSFVDVKEASGLIYRYVLADPPRPAMTRTPVADGPARYAVQFSNRIDPDDRRLWIASTTVTITDTSNNALMATSTWYALEPGQGSLSGERAPWGFAERCPSWNSWLGGQTRMFVDQVLNPKRGS